MNDIGKWATEHASILVMLSLILATATAAVLGLICSLWIRPKLKLLDDLHGKSGTFETVANVGGVAQRVAAVDAKVSLLPDVSGLAATVAAIKETLDRERNDNVARLAEMKLAIQEASDAMRKLGIRSLREGERMMNARHTQYAVEQADQDVILYSANEKITRYDLLEHPKAVELLEEAKKRRALLAEQQKLDAASPPGPDFRDNMRST